MNDTLSSILKHLSPLFHEALVSADGLKRLNDIACYMPFSWSNIIGFETRLFERSASLDLFLFVERNKRKSVLDHIKKSDFRKCFDHPSWQIIRRFFERWQQPGSIFDEYITRVIFEFDVPGKYPGVPIPAMFIQLNDQASATGSEHNLFESALMKYFEEVFQNGLDGNQASISSTIQNVKYCLKHLNAEAKIDHIAVMSSRNPIVFRVNVTNMTNTTLYQLLDQIGIKDQLDSIKQTIEPLYSLADFLVLALDVSDHISPRIGIEYRMPKDSLHLSTQSRWNPFFDVLLREGFAISAKVDALLKWSGRSRDIYHPALFQYYLYQYLNHIKTVFYPGKTPEFKGYFSLRFEPVVTSNILK